MAITNASQMRAVTKERPPIEEFIMERIKLSSAKGFNSARCWVNSVDEKRVTKLMSEGGYTVVEQDREGERVNLEFGW